ncbi:MAG: hypothetical protein CMM52_12585 [Rhodospirillaceae bacterium]|nr:hypothetical protein [Rhodospirillaceae bacterium]|tara:strand:- start:130905 stop:131378 length:474 start_codon:yes stop_codon:yes gene_type:complete
MKRTFIIATGLALAGCSNFPDIPLLNDQYRSKPIVRGAEVPRHTSNGKSTAESVPKEHRLAMRIAPKPKRKPYRKPIKHFEPKKLVGLTQAQVRNMIGAPVTIVDSPPSTVWSYRSTNCALDVFSFSMLAPRLFGRLHSILRAQQKRARHHNCVLES